jgi:8-oxo-dGTP diphosphatase
MAATRKQKGAAALEEKTVENRREVSAGGLIWRRDRGRALEMVLVKPAGRDYWTFPKGHVEKGESITQAALREVREETGLTVSETRPLGEVSYIYSFHENPDAPLVRIFKRVHFFLMRLEGGDTSKHDSEIDQVVWFNLQAALRKSSFESERKLISKAAAMLSE